MRAPYCPCVLLASLLAWAVAGAGCATMVRHAPPEELLGQVQVYGLSDIRAFSGIPSKAFSDDFAEVLKQKEGQTNFSILAISGGGANGAYGAGLLNGWSKEGSRPSFSVVTGISTGAIISPFAFLGPDYDDEMKEFYTTYSTRDLLKLRIPFKNSLASMRPLARQIARYVTAEMLERIAREYHLGRRLYVGTTDLDAQRLVVWNMGKIASVGNDSALELFRRIILASASIPIVSEPVYLDVEMDSVHYDEMHVDGGVIKQVFFPYDIFQGLAEAVQSHSLTPVKFSSAVYVIRNGYVDPVYSPVPDRITAIAARTIDTMINNQSIGDLYQIYTFSQQHGGDFHLAYIPSTYSSRAKQVFDPVEMRRLFALGYERAVSGYPWEHKPPGLIKLVP